MRHLFTPGPWRLAPAHEYSTSALNVDAGTRAYIAECGHRGDVEAEANARLIAAAPDLLAALQDALNGSAQEWNEDAWIDSASAAIAKATQEPTT